MRKTSLILCTALLIAGCAASYPFPIKAPASDILKTDYKGWKNEFAANSNYFFSLLVPNDWKILQTSTGREPEGEKPLELGMFREPGDWMKEDGSLPEREILVEVFTQSGTLLGASTPDQAPTLWLQNKLRKTIGDYTLLQQRTFTSTMGPATDFLIHSGVGEDALVSRIAAYHVPGEPDKLFVLVCSATVEGYERVADAFATAIITFRSERKLK